MAIYGDHGLAVKIPPFFDKTPDLHVSFPCARAWACAQSSSLSVKLAQCQARGPGGPDKLSSLCNNHMTILHSSLHKYILAVHDLHCIPRYISTYT